MSKVCIAKILTAHGVRGLVKIDCYLEDADELENYNPLIAADGKEYTLTLKNSIKGKWLAEIKGVNDRTAAEKYRNIELFTNRDNLPEPEEGIYHEDLIGLDVLDKNGVNIGTIISVDNFGASDLIEVKPTAGKNFYLPFTEPYLIETDLDNKRVIVDQAEEFMV